jgi:hypothetical protein
MSEATGQKLGWIQIAQELGFDSQNLLKPDPEATRLLHAAMLRGQSEVLKGIIAVLDRQVGKLEQTSPDKVREKIQLR